MIDKKEFFIPYIQVDENIRWNYRPAISFKDFKKMLGIDLLKFEKVGCDILICEKTLYVLEFMEQWVIYDNEPYLTNLGMLNLFREFDFIHLKFFKKYSSFIWTNSLAKDLNDILETKKRNIRIEKEFREEQILRLKKIEKESKIHISYIKNIMPNFFENSYKIKEVI